MELLKKSMADCKTESEMVDWRVMEDWTLCELSVCPKFVSIMISKLGLELPY